MQARKHPSADLVVQMADRLNKSELYGRRVKAKFNVGLRFELFKSINSGWPPDPHFGRSSNGPHHLDSTTPKN